MAKKRRNLRDLIIDEVKHKSLFKVETESGYCPDWEMESRSCVAEIKPTHERAHEPDPLCWVQTYWVSRHRLKHEYYRFCYLKTPGIIGSCVRVHLPGGNTKCDRSW